MTRAGELLLLVGAFSAAQAAGPAAAQAQPGGAAPAIAGTWDVTWDMGLRTDGARVVEVTRRGTAVLALVAHGDSVSGTWHITATGDASQLTGTFENRELRLRSVDAVVRDGGREMPVVMRWVGRLEGGRLTGTMYLSFRPGEPPPRKWEAVRRGR